MHERNALSLSTAAASPTGTHVVTAAELVRRQARKLHRAAHSDSLAAAMPALRRIHAACVFPGRALSALYRERRALKRKHFLRALAVEAGFPDWERLRPRLDRMPPEAFEHYKVTDEWCAFLNAWFSNEEQAVAYAREHGGRVPLAHNGKIHRCFRAHRRALIPTTRRRAVREPGYRLWQAIVC